MIMILSIPTHYTFVYIICLLHHNLQDHLRDFDLQLTLFRLYWQLAYYSSDVENMCSEETCITSL